MSCSVPRLELCPHFPRPCRQWWNLRGGAPEKGAQKGGAEAASLGWRCRWEESIISFPNLDVQCLPATPLGGRRSRGVVRHTFHKRNAVVERAQSSGQGSRVQEESQECRSVGTPRLCLGNQVWGIVCLLNFTSRSGLLPVI